MKLVYGISRWSNPSKPASRHIDAGNGKPLCGGFLVVGNIYWDGKKTRVNPLATFVSNITNKAFLDNHIRNVINDHRNVRS